MDSQTALHPIGLAAMLVLGLATFVVPRRYALAPMLIMACFIPMAQRIVFATLDFHMLRLMVLFGWARVLMTGEGKGFRWKPIDTLVVLWAWSALVVPTLRERTMEVFVYHLGLTFDSIGMYFLFRLLLRNWCDVEAIIRCAALISVPVAVAFLIEHSTGRNMFSIVGNVAEITIVRDGRMRCQGPFPHPIIAGCFWVVLMPLIGALWWRGRRTRWLAPIGLTASLVVIFTTGSATPISAVGAAALGAALYGLRRYMGWIRWAGLAGLVGLHLVMVNPVWHLFARIRLVGGTGWYRFKMIDEFVNRIGEWWFAGTNAYADWWQYSFGAITNQYVLEGVDGGILALGLFLAVIISAFRGVGRIGRAVGGHGFHQVMAWGLGVSLFVHCTDFLAITYFGQIIVVWYLCLAMVGSLQPSVAKASRRLRRVTPARPNIAVRRDPGEPLGQPALAGV